MLPASLEINSKVALVLEVRLGGFEVIVVSGFTVSIVHVYDAGDASVLPAVSVALTWNV